MAAREEDVRAIGVKTRRSGKKARKGVSKPVRTVQWDTMWTTEEMVDAQRTDPDVSPILRSKVDGDQRPTWEEISIESPATKSYWAEWERLYLRGDLLYRKWESDDGKYYRFQLVLPRKYQEVVLRNLHDVRTSAHLGQKRTNEAVAQRFFWYKMRESVNRWCATCDRCQRRKRPGNIPHAPMRVYNVGYPGERIAMDICGPFPLTERNNRYILVVADYFTKWSEMYPIPDQTAISVANVFVNNWVIRWGCPRELHTDQGQNFEGVLFKEVCAMLDIRKTRTTPYFPQSDGMVEVKNAVMAQMLNAIGNSEQSDWDLMLPFCMLAYNSTVHEATGECPSTVQLGRLLNLPLDVMTTPHPDLQYTYASDYVKVTEDRIQRTFRAVRDKLGQTAKRNKRYYDRKFHLNCYRRGDLVLMKTSVRVLGKSPKIMDRYNGPYVVLDKLSDVTYRIQAGPNKRARIVHHDRLKAYAPRDPLENDTSWIDRHNRPEPVLLSPEVENPPEVASDVEAGEPEVTSHGDPAPETAEDAEVGIPAPVVNPESTLNEEVTSQPEVADDLEHHGTQDIAEVPEAPGNANGLSTGDDEVTSTTITSEPEVPNSNDLDETIPYPPDSPVKGRGRKAKRAPNRLGDWVLPKSRHQ